MADEKKMTCVEAVARAMAIVDGWDVGEMTDNAFAAYASMARAAIAALSKNVTDEMVQAFRDSINAQQIGASTSWEQETVALSAAIAAAGGE